MLKRQSHRNRSFLSMYFMRCLTFRFFVAKRSWTTPRANTIVRIGYSISNRRCILPQHIATALSFRNWRFGIRYGAMCCPLKAATCTSRVAAVRPRPCRMGRPAGQRIIWSVGCRGCSKDGQTSLPCSESSRCRGRQSTLSGPPGLALGPLSKRPYVCRAATKGHQAISGHQRPSAAISGHQKSSHQ